MTVSLQLLFIAMLTNGHNHWHDVAERKQLISKL